MYNMRRILRNYPVEIFLATVLSRVLLLMVTLIVFHLPLEKYTSLRDGWGYLAQANAFRRLDFSLIDPFNARLFPGYPFLVALLGTVIGLRLASLVISIGGAFLACWLLYCCLKDIWLTRYFYFLPPTWLAWTALTLSEGPFMALQMGALYFFLQERLWAVALLLGYATITRPVGVFLLLSMIAALVYQKKYAHIPRLLVYYLVFPTILFVFNQVVYDNVFINWSQYDAFDEGNLITLPFSSILAMTLSTEVPLWKKCYVLLHVLFTFVAWFTAVKAFQRERNGFSLLILVWISLSTIFYLSIGQWWGAHQFVVYIVSMFPALLYTLRQWLPKNYVVLTFCWLVSFALSLVAMSHSITAARQFGWRNITL